MASNENLTREVVNHHLTAFGGNDLDAILHDYTEESQVLTPEGIIKGLAAIRKFFAAYFVTIPTGSAFEIKQLIVTGSTAYIVWASDSQVASIPLGTDTYILQDGKIRLHTVAAQILPK